MYENKCAIKKLLVNNYKIEIKIKSGITSYKISFGI